MGVIAYTDYFKTAYIYGHTHTHTHTHTHRHTHLEVKIAFIYHVMMTTSNHHKIILSGLYNRDNITLYSSIGILQSGRDYRVALVVNDFEWRLLWLHWEPTHFINV